MHNELFFSLGENIQILPFKVCDIILNQVKKIVGTFIPWCIHYIYHESQHIIHSYGGVIYKFNFFFFLFFCLYYDHIHISVNSKMIRLKQTQDMSLNMEASLSLLLAILQ
jgi:hypothetical protein